MGSSMAQREGLGQPLTRDLSAPALGTSVGTGQAAGSQTCDQDFLIDLLNEAIRESTWHGRSEALAVAMHIDRGYFSKVRSKEKPLNVKILRALPDDLEAIFVAKWAEAFGLVVVAPAQGPDAVKSFVSGLLGMMSAPARDQERRRR